MILKLDFKTVFRYGFSGFFIDKLVNVNTNQTMNYLQQKITSTVFTHFCLYLMC